MGAGAPDEIVGIEGRIDRELLDERIDGLVEDHQLRITPALGMHVGQNGRQIALQRPVVDEL
jgi:hypothetical protein